MFAKHFRLPRAHGHQTHGIGCPSPIFSYCSFRFSLLNCAQLNFQVAPWERLTRASADNQYPIPCRRSTFRSNHQRPATCLVRRSYVNGVSTLCRRRPWLASPGLPFLKNLLNTPDASRCHHTLMRLSSTKRVSILGKTRTHIHTHPIPHCSLSFLSCAEPFWSRNAMPLSVPQVITSPETKEKERK